jgi:hypothetical protein
MLGMLATALLFAVGDCHIDADEAQCEMASRYGLIFLLLAPLAGIATSFLVSRLVDKRR